jgi:hypothetical protein
MNHNLVALHEDLNMLARFSGQDAAGKAARHRGQEAAIVRTGHHFGFALTQPKKGFTPCFLGDKPPSAMALIHKYASRTSGSARPTSNYSAAWRTANCTDYPGS